MFESIEDIRRANQRIGGVWFSEDTMAFWRTRVDSTIYPVESGAYFVTSDRTFDDRRAWTVRFAHLDGRVETLTPFQGYRSSISAHRDAARRAG